MGNKPHRDTAKGVVDNDSTKIAELESQVQLYAARASQMQVRLISTLDAMDAIRAEHKKELAAERRTAASLGRKLETCRKHVQEAQGDWDDMREALSAVVEKVGLVNDYARWPHSQIHLTSPLEPLNTSTASTSTAKPDSDSPLYAHAQAVISSLRDELESERRAHAHTREQADAVLLSLNARLARREAELEACVMHVSHPLPRPSQHMGTHSTAAKKTSRSSPIPLTQDDAIKILELSAARNRTLETEIRNLHGQLEKTRSRGDKKAQFQAYPETHHGEELSSEQTPPGNLHAVQPEDVRVKPPIFKIQRTIAAQGSPADPSPGETRTPATRPPVSYPSQGPMSTSVPSSLNVNLGEQPAAPATSDSDHPRGPITAPPQSEDTARLHSGVNAGSDSVRSTSTAQQQGREVQSREATPGGSSMDPEHGRLEVVVDALRRELEAVRVAGKDREDKLQREINHLRKEVAQVAMRNNSFDNNTIVAQIGGNYSADKFPAADHGLQGENVADNVLGPVNILNGDDEERSMELATPLQPTILSVREDLLDTSPREAIDPPLIPLPTSPHSPTPSEFPSWLLPSVIASPPLERPPPWWPHPHTPSDTHTEALTGEGEGEGESEGEDAIARLEMIERELALARRDLEERDAELGELRGIVQELMRMASVDDAGGTESASDG